MKRLFIFEVFLAFYLLAYFSDAEKQVFHATNLIIKNAGFESGKAGWTSSGTPTTYNVQATTVGAGKYSLNYDPDADGEYIETDAYTVPSGYLSRNGVACVRYKGADSNLEINIIDGLGNELKSEALEASTGWTDRCVNFGFPASGTVKLRLEAEGDAATGYFDDVFIGDANRVNISKVSSENLYGSIKYAGVTNCAWSTTSATYANFAADTDCNAPTVTGKASAPATKIPAIYFSSLPAGEYYIVLTGMIYPYEASGEQAQAKLRFSDGTNSTAGNHIGMGSGSAANFMAINNLTGKLRYTTAQSNITIQIQGLLSAGDSLNISNATANDDLEISVYRFPLESETAFSPNADNGFAGMSSAGATNCLWFSNGASYANFNDDSDCSTPTMLGSGVAVSKYPAVTKTNIQAGSYLVVANGGFTAQYATSTTDCDFTISDGTTTFGYARTYATSGTVGEFVGTVAGVVTYTAFQATKTFHMQARRNAGAGDCIIANNLAGRSFNIQVIPISTSINQPQILNQVSSPSSGGVRVASAYITNTGTPAISRQDGNWISAVYDGGTGEPRIDLVAGAFSAAPSCVYTASYNGANFTAFSAPTTTQYVYIKTWNAAGSVTDMGFDIICVGAK